jgi:hypothetical protein
MIKVNIIGFLHLRVSYKVLRITHLIGTETMDKMIRDANGIMDKIEIRGRDAENRVQQIIFSKMEAAGINRGKSVASLAKRWVI